jgi:hypothetical protein
MMMARRKLTTNPSQVVGGMALIRQAGTGELGRGITYLSWAVAIRAFWHLDVRGGCVLLSPFRNIRCFNFVKRI